MKSKKLAISVALLASTIVSAAAHATKLPPTSVERLLIEPDAILFGTVESIAEAADVPGILVVKLNGLRLVDSRWDVKADRPFEFRIRGAANDLHCARPLRYEPPLCVGDRYLLLMKGGEWQNSPTITFAQSIYRVQRDPATVLCSGGSIFGLGILGFVCSSEQHQASPPPTETELALLISSELENARLRRPELVKSTDENVQPLSHISTLNGDPQ